ncbi:DUF3053 domain-containing protein [Enterobacillus tribolii]|uniref:DUF3053 family protein n=1 Tax=Enterobacillus tribolii TaxID=1487935 RepID=A0A370QUT5_9GAMM|nr:DUF3053 domain-containing protein [Enterobacillus tribolii]MBW7981012.1 DUF3053 domain-containing protein [Enterobacillus tribolii]RDK92931.1 hypothetical protein C8D90_103324 [Enterobacillus tribolii]
MVFAVTRAPLKRWLMPVMAIMMVFQLAACGDKEADQRKAFIDYLQNTVMRGSSKVPTLSEDQKQKLGKYTGDYAILVTFSQNFSRATDSSLTPLNNTISQIRVPQDYLLKRDELRQASGALNMLGQQVQSARAQADSAKAALKQPDDLRVVYDKAYAKVVSDPANAIGPMIPMAASLAQDLLQVGDFLQYVGPQARFENSGIQLQTQQQVAQYNQMMSNVAAKHQELLAAQSRSAAVLN